MVCLRSYHETVIAWSFGQEDLAAIDGSTFTLSTASPPHPRALQSRRDELQVFRPQVCRAGPQRGDDVGRHALSNWASWASLSFCISARCAGDNMAVSIPPSSGAR